QDQDSGLWYQVMDHGSRSGNYLEATASSMLVYILAKGVNRGFLSGDFVGPLSKAYQGIVGRLIKTGDDERISLTRCCSVAGLGFGRDGSYEYYLREPVVDNDLKGVGPFILAGIELQRLAGLPSTAETLALRQNASGPSSIAPEWTNVTAILARIQPPVIPDR